jgi:hypothetical protein
MSTAAAGVRPDFCTVARGTRVREVSRFAP